MTEDPPQLYVSRTMPGSSFNIFTAQTVKDGVTVRQSGSWSCLAGLTRLVGALWVGLLGGYATVGMGSHVIAGERSASSMQLRL